MTTKITPCGGCGETDSKKRCIGCLHVFFPGDWPEKYQGGSAHARHVSPVPSNQTRPKGQVYPDEWGW